MSDAKTRGPGPLASVKLFFTDRDKLEPAVITLLAAIFAILMGVGLIFVVSKDLVN